MTMDKNKAADTVKGITGTMRKRQIDQQEKQEYLPVHRKSAQPAGWALELYLEAVAIIVQGD